MINAYAYSSAGPQISEVDLLGSNLGRAKCFASLMCIMYTCAMLQSVQRRGIHSATDGAMFYKEPFCLGTLSTDQFENGLQHWLQQSLL